MRITPFSKYQYVGGLITVTKFGGNDAIAATETIWSAGGLYVWPDTVELVSVVSTDGGDTAAGAGARTVTVSGLDANFDEQSETIILNGVGAKDSTLTFSRVFRMFVASAGSYSATNVGTITATHKVSGDTLCTIPIAKGQSKVAFYTVPAGFTAFITDVHLSVSPTNNGVTLELFQRQNADQFVAPFSAMRLVAVYTDVQTPVAFQHPVGLTFPEKTDLEWRGTKVGVGGDPAAEVEFTIILAANNK
jgi:hypothetical protein